MFLSWTGDSCLYCDVAVETESLVWWFLCLLVTFFDQPEGISRKVHIPLNELADKEPGTERFGVILQLGWDSWEKEEPLIQTALQQPNKHCKWQRPYISARLWVNNTCSSIPGRASQWFVSTWMRCCLCFVCRLSSKSCSETVAGYAKLLERPDWRLFALLHRENTRRFISFDSWTLWHDGRSSANARSKNLQRCWSTAAPPLLLCSSQECSRTRTQKTLKALRQWWIFHWEWRWRWRIWGFMEV